ncbi:MAG: DUF2716 domain-containing protein [Ilumatobacteraceae bacterium]
MTESAWTPIDDYERYWTPFDAAYSFAPRYADEPAQEPRPGISEPPGAVTFSLAPITQSGSPAQYWAGVHLLNAGVLRAFVTVFPAEQRLVVLDWQHQSYWFRPHAHAIGEFSPEGLTPMTWPVCPFPDGDYHIFLSEDLSSGTFGHPWEQSLCVFGRPLVEVLAPVLSSWLPMLRGDALS